MRNRSFEFKTKVKVNYFYRQMQKCARNARNEHQQQEYGEGDQLQQGEGG